MKVVLITSLENAFDRKLAAAFAHNDGQNEYKVYAIHGEEQSAGPYTAARIDGVTLLPHDLTDAVHALQKDSGHIDIYIDVSDKRSPADDFTVRGVVNDKVIHELYEANVIRPMALLEAFLPLLEAGEGKRLCYITPAEASINETRATDGFGYRMAKAALHNFLQITRNVLVPKGYTLRAYDPMQGKIPPEVPPEAAAEAALNYFTRRRGIERGDPLRDDEDNLVFRDAYGRQHPW